MVTVANIGAARGAQVNYQLGNSLTEDSSFAGCQRLAADARRYLSPCHFIRGGATLDYILNNPNDPTYTQGGLWPAALPARPRNVFTFQSYPPGTGASTLGLDQAAIEAFVASILSGPSQGQRYFLYAAWPRQTATGGDYQAFWTQPVINAANTTTLLAAQYFDHLYSNLSAVTPLFLMPIGECLYELDILARDGQLPGIATINDFYRDDNHMGQCGRFVAGLVSTLCTFRVPVAASAATVAFYAGLGGGATLTDALAEDITASVVSTLQNEPRSGFPDTY